MLNSISNPKPLSPINFGPLTQYPDGTVARPGNGWDGK